MLDKLLDFSKYPVYLKFVWAQCMLFTFLSWQGLQSGKRVRLIGMPIVNLFENSKIIIGNDVILCSHSKMTDLGVNHAVVLRTLRPNAVITIGENTAISGGSFCAAIRIDIGKSCLIGANVTVVDTDFHPIRPEGRRYNANVEDITVAPVVIEDNVFIGTGAYILKGVRIGENSIVGAGSVVTKDVPKDSIVAGNPSRVVKYLVKGKGIIG